MKKFLIISQFMSMPNEDGNSRFKYIANLLKDLYDIEIISTNFYHVTKQHRTYDSQDNIGYKYTLLEEPGYKKNVSLKRLYSHKIFAKNAKKYLKNYDKTIDIIYLACPSLDVCKVVTKFAKKNKIRLIVDIQDLWPEAFKMVFNIPVISNLIFYPMKKKADYIYKNADDIIAVSDTYLKRALEVNKKSKNNISVFLGTDLEYFDSCKERNKIIFDDNYIRLVYIGTLGSSYNIKIIIDAINQLNKKGINNLKFIVMGNGPLKQEFEDYAKVKQVDCEFTGRLDYEKMVGLLCSCDIAVNPIMKGAAQSIINKVGDYAAAGLPVISTQENYEYRNLIEQYECGFNCENSNIEDVANKLEILIKDKELRKKYGSGNRKLAEEKFDRKKSYNEIIDLLENI